MSQKFLSAAALGLTASLILGGSAMAASTPKTERPAIHRTTSAVAYHIGTGSRKNAPRPGGQLVTGTVASVSGSVITLTTKDGASYAINTTGAKIMKAGASIDVSAIQVGDLLMARGTLSGLSMTANTIVDGVVQKPAGATDQKLVVNKGARRVMGSITAISGTTLSLTLPAHKGKTPMTLNVLTDGTTVVTKDKVAATFADLATGQSVSVTGAKDVTTGDFTASKINISTHALGAQAKSGFGRNHKKTSGTPTP